MHRFLREECPNIRSVSDDDALIEAIKGPSDTGAPMPRDRQTPAERIGDAIALLAGAAAFLFLYVAVP